MDKSETKIIDVRSADAFNGWQLQNEPRGGHIKNAKSLPAKWLLNLDWIEIVRRKQILPNHHIVVYSYNDADSVDVGERFLKSGYPHVSIYHGFVKEWSANIELPMQHLERFQNLVPASWINSLISDSQPPNFSNDKYIIIHVHYRNRDAYLSGHIPGAIDMDTLAVEAPGMWNRRDPQELMEAFIAHGITADTTVILYGKHMFPDKNDAFPGKAAGDIGAMRCASVMLYAGVKDVRVLNGGFQSWNDEGFEISYTDVIKKAVPKFGVFIPTHPEFIIDMPQARQMLTLSDSELVCVRSWREFIGEVSGYNYIDFKGRIPGAIFADSGSDAYHMENYRNFDQTCREYHEIAENWTNNGITPDKHLAFYCGTGWRGSEAWFNAWLMGWPRICVFDGGWLEWSSDPNNPIETGIPPSRSGVNCSFIVGDRLQHKSEPEFISEILNGLSAEQKSISSNLFYDDEGSVLFEEISRLSAYYLTQTESVILKEATPRILDSMSINNIIELGSGDCSKISILLEAVPKNNIAALTYIPVDINKTSIEKSAKVLLLKFPGIRVHGILADYIEDFNPIPCEGSKLICFFGSTFGNLNRKQEIPFLLHLKSWMNSGDRLLIGFDMVKDVYMLEKAYNDEEGITAAFNKNILNVVNRYTKTNFCPEQFDHYSFYNSADARIEMHLRARTDIEVSSPHIASKICLREGETIHTENSNKFDSDYIHQLAKISGLQIVDFYTDIHRLFSLVQFQK